jgi:uncharacterized protein (TIGR02271 family)
MQNLVAFFEDQADAMRAISALKGAGVSPRQIGVSAADDLGTDSESFNESGVRADKSLWDKISEFFTGSDYDDLRDTSRNYNFSDRSWANYRDRIEGGGVLVTVYDATNYSELEGLLSRHGGVIDRDVEFEPIEPKKYASSAHGDGPRRIQLLSEVLRVNKERVTAGEARIRKEVITENQNIQVPVTREELVIERRPVNEPQAASREIGVDSEIRVPLSEERVSVERKPIVREEVEVGKRQVTEERTVGDQVRHEELKVDEDRKTIKDQIRPKGKKIA